MAQSYIMREMVQEVAERYGKDSFEAGYIQFVFSKRSDDQFFRAYRNLMQ